jgi:hypothetical protein
MVNPASESWSFILALLPARFRRSRALHQLAPQSDQRALTRRELGRPPRPSSLHFLGTSSQLFSVALSTLHGTNGTYGTNELPSSPIRPISPFRPMIPPDIFHRHFDYNLR